MSGGINRLGSGGAIDRASPIHFTFGDTVLEGFAGDTLASALIANGVGVIGVSARGRRPRGVLSAGLEEPSAFVRVASGGVEFIAPATAIGLFDGLVAAPIRRAETAKKRFPAFGGRLAQALTRTLSRTASEPPAAFAAPVSPCSLAAPHVIEADALHAHCDVLIVGGGPAGLAAALAALTTSTRVIVAERSDEFGGALLYERFEIDGSPAAEWLRSTLVKLKSQKDATLLTRTTVAGCFDDRLVALRQRLTAPGSREDVFAPRERLWKVHAKEIVFATGSIEQPMVFADNDRPGVMLAGAVRRYIQQYAVLPGREAVIFTNNDGAYQTALDLLDAGAKVRAVVDARENPQGPLPLRVRERAVEVIGGSVVTHALGEPRIAGVLVAGVDERGARLLRGAREIACDLLCVSAGWNPELGLYAGAGGAIAYNAERNAFLPTDKAGAHDVAGSAEGRILLRECIESGFKAGRNAAERAKAGVGPTPRIPSVAEKSEAPMRPLQRAPGLDKNVADDAQWVDLYCGVTTADVAAALENGARTMSALAAHTGLGSGPERGATGWLAAAGVLAALQNKTPGEADLGHGPPSGEAIVVGGFANSPALAAIEPYRLSPVNRQHEELAAVFEIRSRWRLPAYYPGPGENRERAIRREALAMRRHPLIHDDSARGKFMVSGGDAARFLDRLASCDVLALPPGGVTRGYFLDRTGAILDDCEFLCADEGRYLVLTSEAAAERIENWLEEWRQCDWPDLRVFVTPSSARFACFSILGPRAGDAIGRLAPAGDSQLSSLAAGQAAALPLSHGEGFVYRSDLRSALEYRILAPASLAAHVWQTLIGAGAETAATPIGFMTAEALAVERGVAPPALWIEGAALPTELGGEAALGKPRDFIGKNAALASAEAGNRRALIGLRAERAESMIPPGALLIPEGAGASEPAALGEVVASSLGPTVGYACSLALIENAGRRTGERIGVFAEGGVSRASIVALPFATEDRGGSRDE